MVIKENEALEEMGYSIQDIQEGYITQRRETTDKKTLEIKCDAVFKVETSLGSCYRVPLIGLDHHIHYMPPISYESINGSQWFIGQKCFLKYPLIEESKAFGLNQRERDNFTNTIPCKLLNSLSFFDKLSAIWHYEFASISVTITLKDGNKEFLFSNGQEVKTLFKVLWCAYQQLNKNEREKYFHRLVDESRHLNNLTEMMPVLRIDANIPLKFQYKNIPGKNTDFEWKIGPVDDGHAILLEVKDRMFDLYNMYQRENPTRIDPQSGIMCMNEPSHNHDKLFEDVERKFDEQDSSLSLQGVWISSRLAQNEDKFLEAFNKLNPKKIHFAILGCHTEEAYCVNRKEEDKLFLKNILKLDLKEGKRTFKTKDH